MTVYVIVSRRGTSVDKKAIIGHRSNDIEGKVNFL
jgi:hypothetical protein